MVHSVWQVLDVKVNDIQFVNVIEEDLPPAVQEEVLEVPGPEEVEVQDLEVLRTWRSGGGPCSA